MAGTFDAGSVVYEVDMDTSRLLAARREVDAALNGLNGSMGRLEASVNRTERSIGTMERTMSSLSGVAKGLLAALSVQQVASYADAWTELNNKVANSVRTGETQAEVMQRIFDVSQATQSSLNGTATLYARLERGTRTYNTSAEDLTRLTTIINQGFAVSGATAQEAENAIIQLSQGIASGVLRGEEFNSVSEQGSRLMVALADSMGVSIGQLRAMAAQGQLTTDIVVKGLLSQGDAIGKEFANTTVSIAKGLQVAGNNVTKFFGENSTVKSFAAGFRDSVITISENLETLGTALIGAAAIMGGRFAGALAMATAAQASRVKATIQGIVATRQSAQQEAAAASVTARKAVADKDAALSALNLATAEYNVAKGSAAEAFALENVIRLRGIYVATSAEAALANNALAASQAKVAATGITFANTMKVVNSVTAPLGGPIGVIAIVAAGWYLYSQRQAEARKEAIAFADTVPDVIKRLKDMNLAQAQGVRADTVTSIEAQKEAISDLKDTISGLQSDYEKYTTLARQYGVTEDQNNGFVIKARDAANELAKKRRDLDGATATLKQTEDALHLINIQVNQGIVDQMRAARDNAIAIAEAEKQASFLGGTQAFLAEKLGQSTQALKAFNSESLKINWGGKEGEKLIKQAERRLALSKLEGEAKARQQAAYDAEDAGVTDELAIKRLQDNYAATERNTQARKDQKKEDKAAESEAKKLANQQESVAQKLANLKQQSELAAGSTQELSREQAVLQAQQSLGKGATQEQIALAGKYRGEIWDTANALKAQAAAEKLLPEARENASYQQDVKDLQTALAAKKITQQQYNQTSEQLEAQHQVNLAKIRAQQTVSPMQEARGQIDPVQQLANQHAQELALIQQFESQKGQITQRGLELMNAANTQYEQQRIAAQWEIWRQQNAGYEVAAAAFDSFAGNASNALTGIITGSMSVSEAMRSLGSTVLNSVINSFVQMGVEWLKSVIMGQAGMTAASGMAIAQGQLIAASMAPAAAMTSLATAGANAIPAQAGIASTVGMAQALSIAGARYNGGPVSAGGLYQVGEKGKPEIYQASTGKQYMIPGDNGKVISNKDMQSGGGISVQVNVINQSTGATVQSADGYMQDGSAVVDLLITDMERGGPVSSQMQQTFGLSRKAQGAY
ncbi:TPA: tape measure protein [Klebsiella pneumoniae]|jgi:tape measure domain-containing protein|uniref:tape measure protein n=1 Tax=Klebsiella TaxID=570 RepID=UPI00163A6787|nr:tape measure protein [Klebsiella pneumoniae]DAI88388.1 MAG TPA: tail length tape measure protein [Caudoviricetes sp.]MBE0162336.1 tape measure protein [Klebsiella pneumoniae]MBK1598727.1 tape measure protein [Klebsiella pneumoniae]HBQ2174601.1 tape measure protein [Klebsiella pneumoniae]HBS7354448.1 tape measure protein [Klebsiella pneumoniae]